MKDRTLSVGVQLCPQHCSMDQLRGAWRAADALGVNSIFVWDHFFPLSPPEDGSHFEAWSLVAAMAVETRTARIGTLVSCVAYRNPDLLADLARTVDHLSDGRVVLGVGAGWAKRDFEDYGYPFVGPLSRLAQLETALERIRARFSRLNPGPRHAIPVLVGGSGERVTLRLAAQHADIWNCIEPPDALRRKNEILDEWCETLGRDPSRIARSVCFGPEDVDLWREFRDAGATELIVGLQSPYDLTPVARLLAAIGDGPADPPSLLGDQTIGHEAPPNIV